MKGSHKIIIVTLITVAAIAVGFSMKSGSGKASNEERAKIFHEATARAATQGDYPKTEQELLTKFWQAMTAADWETVTTLCPGSRREDFAMYEKFKPGPIKKISTAEAHPKEADVRLFAVSTSFPGFPEKTVKLAVRKANDRLTIDGRNTVWW